MELKKADGASAFDSVLESVGQFGKYQWLQLALLWNMLLPAAFSIMTYVLVAGVPEFSCADFAYRNATAGLNITDFHKCQQHVLQKDGNWTLQACNDWVFGKEIYGSTITEEWDLVCDGAWMRPTTQTVFFAGYLLGGIFFGDFSDRFGRLKALLLSLFVQGGFALINAFATSVTYFAACRAFVGLGVGGSVAAAFTLGLELVGPRVRADVGCVYSYAWVTYLLVLCGVGFLITDWFYLQIIAGSIPLITCLLYFLFLDESPRWLLATGKMAAAEKVLRKIAKVNGRRELTRKQLEECYQLTNRAHTEESGDYFAACGKPSLLDCLRTPNLRMLSLTSFYLWFLHSFVYYGLSLNSGNLSGHPIVNFLISAAVEMPGNVFCQVLMKRVGRKFLVAFCTLVGGISCLCVGAVPKDPAWIIITLSMIGKFCISSSFGCIYIYTTEIYPTIIRNIGLGTCTTFARVGAMIAPYAALVGESWEALPFLIFGVVSVLGGILVTLLPETRGKSFPETIAQGELFAARGSLREMVCSTLGKQYGAKGNTDFSSERNNVNSTEMNDMNATKSQPV